MKRESEYEAKTNTDVRLRYTELEKHGGTITGGGQKSKKRQELSQERRKRMLQLFFTIAFSAAPLTLYIPPIRCLTVFVETMEEMGMEGRVYSRRLFPRARIAWSRLLDCFFSSSRPTLSS
ncbi:hypothetical protein ISN44_As10g020650 [Arabidopsis suecica]|uniref:Uncharacterized protein n=1 Tax=Arabidopsis suecica TaxID=45249 RepID=A0A8T1ZZF0_ARASU|nr:hypothetical protein ISN44_As10g020650 [Arabidopsis suecica]KAG7565370.1 hypothetical protein ISN44_As10g020650 [Arabidopsis suecica]